MKTLMILFFVIALTPAWGQKTQTVVIHTSAECKECEVRLEEELNFTKGVVFAELNLETQDVTVKYNPKKLTPETLKKLINELGYDADEQKADAAALQKLPACCRPNGMKKEE